VTKPPAKTRAATEWLAYIEALHPKAIAMGLERVKNVADKLDLNPTFPIITVAGTNGKGSVCAMLSQIYVESGYRVGCYTSPHLNRYNERVSVNLQHISDDDLCAAFAAVEAARGDVQLTYFEMGTLAAMWHFCRQHLDICILEVGLGGRLDAVNIFEPTCAIVTAVDLDHMEYLGDTREKIGFEKAGIFRANKLAICGDENPPQSLLDYATKIGANLQLIDRDFSVKKTAQGWNYQAGEQVLQLPNLGLVGDFQLNNAACVICAVQHLSEILPATNHSSAGLQPNIHAALRAVNLEGRFQQIHANPQIIVDVAHNPQAAKSLAQNLQSLPCAGKTLAVLGMLADKDMQGVIGAVADEIDAWFLADIHNPRGAKASALQKLLLKRSQNSALQISPQISVQTFMNVQAAMEAACKNAGKNDRIIVFGSFYTVADAIASKFNSLHE
jgi:dihydrofolate synthase / folylpolyglutamate synthase